MLGLCAPQCAALVLPCVGLAAPLSWPLSQQLSSRAGGDGQTYAVLATGHCHCVLSMDGPGRLRSLFATTRSKFGETEDQRREVACLESPWEGLDPLSGFLLSSNLSSQKLVCGLGGSGCVFSVSDSALGSCAFSRPTGLDELRGHGTLLWEQGPASVPHPLHLLPPGLTKVLGGGSTVVASSLP